MTMERDPWHWNLDLCLQLWWNEILLELYLTLRNKLLSCCCHILWMDQNIKVIYKNIHWFAPWACPTLATLKLEKVTIPVAFAMTDVLQVRWFEPVLSASWDPTPLLTHLLKLRRGCWPMDKSRPRERSRCALQEAVGRDSLKSTKICLKVSSQSVAS